MILQCEKDDGTIYVAKRSIERNPLRLYQDFWVIGEKHWSPRWIDIHKKDAVGKP